MPHPSSVLQFLATSEDTEFPPRSVSTPQNILEDELEEELDTLHCNLALEAKLAATEAAAELLRQQLAELQSHSTAAK